MDGEGSGLNGWGSGSTLNFWEAAEAARRRGRWAAMPPLFSSSSCCSLIAISTSASSSESVCNPLKSHANNQEISLMIWINFTSFVTLRGFWCCGKIFIPKP